MKNRQALIQRTYSDANFQARLLKDPRGTLQSEGFEHDDELVSAIENVSKDPTAVHVLRAAQSTFHAHQTTAGSGVST